MLIQRLGDQYKMLKRFPGAILLTVLVFSATLAQHLPDPNFKGEVEKAFEFAQSKGNKNILLYGSSLGSVVAIKAAAEGAVNPKAIIADMPFGSLQDHLEARARTLGFPSQPFAFLVTLWIGIENGYNGFSNDTYDYVKKINCPVLMQWGDKDIYVTEREIKGIFQNLQTRQKQLVVYPGVNHESYLRIDPVSWQKNVTSFIDSLPE